MRERLTQYLARHFERTQKLLDRALADERRFDVLAFEQFRRRLLRQIAIEHKLLLAEIRRCGVAEALPIAHRLQVEHAALIHLLRPTPSRRTASEIRALLAVHNAHEESRSGAYAIFERVLGPRSAELAARAHLFPPVRRVARHSDLPGIPRTATAALAAAARIRDPAPAAESTVAPPSPPWLRSPA